MAAATRLLRRAIRRRHSPFPDTYRVSPKKAPTAYPKDLDYDALVFTPDALRHLAAEETVKLVVVMMQAVYREG